GLRSLSVVAHLTYDDLSLHDALPILWSTTGGVLIIDSDRTFPSDSPVCAYWLTRCEGFAVRSGRRELGVVESIAGGPLGLAQTRSEEHTSELQSRGHLVCRLLLEKKK